MSLISCLLNTYPYAHRQVLYQRTFFATDRDHCRISQVVSVEKWLWGACHQLRHLNPTPTSKGGRGLGDRDVCCEVVSSVYDRRVAFMDYPHYFETRLLKKNDTTSWRANMDGEISQGPAPSCAWMMQLMSALSLREILLIGYLIASNQP